MITKKTNINFPINYGDDPNDDGSIPNDKIVRVIQNKRFQRRILSVAWAVFALGAATITNAIQPEVWEATAAVANAAINGAQVPPVGQIEGGINLPAAQQVPRFQTPVADLKTANIPGPQPGQMPTPRVPQTFLYYLLADKGLGLTAKPLTTAGQITATSIFLI